MFGWSTVLGPSRGGEKIIIMGNDRGPWQVQQPGKHGELHGAWVSRDDIDSADSSLIEPAIPRDRE